MMNQAVDSSRADMAGRREFDIDINIDIIDQLKRHEGFRAKMYLDSVGVLTIGYGINLDFGLTEREAAMLLTDRVRHLRDRLSRMFPFWKQLSNARQDVLINMAYNLGPTRLLKFQKMLVALNEADYEAAAHEMWKSKWAAQVGRRADELTSIMRAG